MRRLCQREMLAELPGAHELGKRLETAFRGPLNAFRFDPPYAGERSSGFDWARGVQLISVMFDLTPWSALAGGALIGLAASLLLLASGRIAGVSGMIGGLLVPTRGDTLWRALFVGGLVAAGLVAFLVAPDTIGSSPRGMVALALAGILVGVGTRLGNGCTSGHGVCGLSRLSKRSLLATLTFVGAGMLTVTLLRVLGGGS